MTEREAALMDAAAAYISEQWPRDVWCANWLASYDKLLDGAPSLTALMRLQQPNVPRTYPQEFLQDWNDNDWQQRPLYHVPIQSLIPTQEGVSLARIIHILNGGEPEANDYARVVQYRGKKYLHDGHHRWLIALIKGDTLLPVRVALAGRWLRFGGGQR